MEKKSAIWVGLMILVIVMGGLLLFTNLSNRSEISVNKSLSEKIAECPKDYQENSIYYPNPNCITKLAIEYNNDSICNYLPSHGTAQNPSGKGYDCVVEVIISHGEINGCGVLRDPTYCEQQINQK